MIIFYLNNLSNSENKINILIKENFKNDTDESYNSTNVKKISENTRTLIKIGTEELY